MKTGNIFVVSAPSGAGKTTLCKRVLANNPDLSYSVSHTTRAPRNNEKHGVDYFFITAEAFEKGIQEKRWAEWAMVHGNFYGTSLDFIKERVASGSNLLLDIDVQGAEQIKSNFPAAVTIFIMAPSVDVLEHRLLSRKTDTEAVIQNRLINARKEIARKGFYDHVIVNDDLEKAVRELDTIVQTPGEGC